MTDGLAVNKVLIDIEGESMLALIDTGASTSCLSPDVYHSLKLEKSYPLQKTDVGYIKGVGDNSVKVLGVATVPIVIAGTKIDHSFMVLEGMKISLILGMDFITDHGVVLNFRDQEMTLHGSMTVAPIIMPENADVEVRIKRYIVLPPRAEIVLPVEVTSLTGKIPPPIGLISPRTDLVECWNVVAAAAVVSITNGNTSCRILNPTNDHISLVPGTVIGTLESIAAIHTEEEAPVVATATPSDSESHNEVLSELGIDLSQTELETEQKERLGRFLAENRDVFALNMAELGTTNLCQHEIDTGNHPPITQRPYRVCPEKKEEISRQVDEMLDHGIIRPSFSRWCSPVVLVRKKDGSYRFAVDYRKLNAVTKPLNYPLPRLDDALDVLNSGAYFSTMDLLSGFWQIEMAPSSKEKTAFVCHKGVFAFEKLPFGLRNAPLQFQAVMESALRGINFKHVLIYVDDLLCFSPDFDSHLKHLDSVFRHLRAAGLRLKPSKCQFAATEVTYLGHIVSNKGVAVDPAKTEAVRSFPIPRDTTSVRSFLGLANYYRRFIKGFAQIAAPMNNLLKSDTPFCWTTDCQDAFERLKDALTSAPVLAYPDFDKEFILSTDASGHALGFILSQKDSNKKERVIAYGGRSLRPPERSWSISERETLALIEGIKNYRVYLAGRKFTAVTDHSALQYLQRTKDPTGRLGRWALFLQEYDFTVQYKPGRIHLNADALSRRPYTDDTSLTKPETEAHIEQGGTRVDTHPSVSTTVTLHVGETEAHTEQEERIDTHHSVSTTVTLCLNETTEGMDDGQGANALPSVSMTKPSLTDENDATTVKSRSAEATTPVTLSTDLQSNENQEGESERRNTDKSTSLPASVNPWPDDREGSTD